MNAAHWTALAFAALGAVFLYIAFTTHVVDVGFVGALMGEVVGGGFIAIAVVIEIVWLLFRTARPKH